MFDFMYGLPDALLFVTCVLLVFALVLAAAGFMLVLRLAWPNRQKTSMVNTMLSGILLPTGLVIAFVASDIWQQDAKGRTAVEQEAMASSDILRTAQHLPAELRGQVTGLMDDYVREVVEREWPLMAHGQASQAAEDLLDALDQMSVQISVAAQEHGANRLSLDHVAKELQRYVQQIETARNQRLVVANTRVVGTKWTAMLVLLFVAACVLYELHAGQRRAVWLAMGLFALGFGATLYLIASFDRPFTGTTIIEPQPLTLVLLRG